MTLAAAVIVEGALREIGQLSPYDDGPDPEDFAIGLQRLDLLLAELVGTERLWFFTPLAQEVVLKADTTEYDLVGNTEIVLEFVDNAYISDGNGNEELVELVRRNTFDDTYDDSPSSCKYRAYIERKDRPKLFIYPAPPTDDWRLYLSGRRYSANVTEKNGQTVHGFPKAWERFLILSLGCDLGAGPITTRPLSEQDRLQKRADAAFLKLSTAHNRENVKRARVTKPRNF